MDDDDLNLIMMRNEDELKVFQQMDKDREQYDTYGPNKRFPRLLSEAELPEIYMTDDAPVVEEIEEPVGRGARERTRVKYDDGLTEEQWLEAVDNDEDSIEAAIARKDAKLSRRNANKAKRVGDLTSPMPSRDSSESPAPKRRGRKPKAEKRKADDASLDGDSVSAPRKRGRPTPNKIQETLSPEDRATLQKVLNTVYEAFNDLEEESADGKLPRGIIDPFIELPDKFDYPDYYQIIKNPICMNNIKRKINRKEYQNLRQFRQDVALLCNNCRTYNEDGSTLYKDANMIERTCVDKLREATQPYPAFQDFDDALSTNGGPSTAPVSSVGTPLAGPIRK
jgi:ATP-dependent helicase STH1/SNF2